MTDLTDTVHRMHNTSTWQERTFAGRLNQWFDMYLHQEGIHHYAINSVLYLTSVRQKYVKMYERFTGIKTIFQSHRNPFERLPANVSTDTFKIRKNPE